MGTGPHSVPAGRLPATWPAQLNQVIVFYSRDFTNKLFVASYISATSCICIDYKVYCEGAHPLCDTLSWQELKPIKLAYDTCQLDGQPIAASAFNQLGQYTSSTVNTAYSYADLAIASIHCAYHELWPG